jgi:hypothetical protein
MHTKTSHYNTHQQLNATCWRTSTQKWPGSFEAHGINIIIIIPNIQVLASSVRVQRFTTTGQQVAAVTPTSAAVRRFTVTAWYTA